MSKRKLTAILSADVVGYSRLMGVDEAATVATLKDYRSLMGAIIARHGGRVVNAPGDALLAEFPSAVEGVQCAVEIQQVLTGRNLELQPERRMEFRIGVNVGDVIEEEDGALYGDGVNIAARMEALAEAGGVCVSSTVYDAVEGKLALGFDFLGEQQVKNISKPVRVHRVRAEPRTPPPRRGGWRGLSPPVQLFVIGSAALILLIAAVALTWQAMRVSAPVEDPVLALPKGPSIAVLPFANLSGDPEQEYFSDGITEEIITELTRFPEVRVLARNSTFQYKGKPMDVRRIGQELGARYVVEGSVRKASGRIRVTAQLLDAKNGNHLWAETYDQDLTAGNIFDVQDEITEKIVATVAGAHGVISRAGLEQAQRVRFGSLDSYNCVLLAMAYRSAVTPESHLRARECLEQAVKEDPKYAEAWAWLAEILVDEYSIGFSPLPGDALDRAFNAAQTAIALDPNNQRAHLAVAGTMFFRHEPALIERAERALVLNPNNTDAVAYMGLYLSQSGHPERGVPLLRKAMALNPNHPRFLYFPLMNYHYFRHEYKEALSYGLRIEMPGFYWYHADLARVYAQLGRLDEARAHVAELNRLNPAFGPNAWREFHKWNWEEQKIEHLIEGMRKAGVQVPPKPGV